MDFIWILKIYVVFVEFMDVINVLGLVLFVVNLYVKKRNVVEVLIMKNMMKNIVIDAGKLQIHNLKFLIIFTYFFKIIYYVFIFIYCNI